MNDNPPPQDFTPQSASPTDIAPLGRGPEKPPHERTAAEEAGDVPWMAISQDPDFLELLASKARFVMPATVFFVVYYFALPILVGWFPEMMGRPVLGSVNLAYLFAFSQFFMAWAVAFLYVAAAMGWDRKAEEILRKFGRL
ncbi:MAG: hypothetical protein Fur0032_08310 [Terrimicrobiaceae bacterium]